MFSFRILENFYIQGIFHILDFYMNFTCLYTGPSISWKIFISWKISSSCQIFGTLSNIQYESVIGRRRNIYRQLEWTWLVWGLDFFVRGLPRDPTSKFVCSSTKYFFFVFHGGFWENIYPLNADCQYLTKNIISRNFQEIREKHSISSMELPGKSRE